MEKEEIVKDMEIVLDALKRRYVNRFNAELSHYERDPYRVLMATILSQRTRDEVTHKATERLFARYPDIDSLAEADEAEVMELIRPVGFYRGKARKIIEAARMIRDSFGGVVPDNIDELLELPGVGRKTANCVLVYGYSKDAIPVDTHVHRLANMWGWVSTKTPEETEVELSKILPRRYWLFINDLLVSFGQDVCRPTNHRCDACPVEIRARCPQCCIKK